MFVLRTFLKNILINFHLYLLNSFTLIRNTFKHFYVSTNITTENMLAVSDLAKNWSRSGEDPGRLYPGSNDQIIALLKIWHAARRTNLSEIITLYRNMLNLHNILYGLGEDLGVDLQAQHQIWDPKLDQMEGHANVRGYDRIPN